MGRPRVTVPSLINDKRSTMKRAARRRAASAPIYRDDADNDDSEEEEPMPSESSEEDDVSEFGEGASSVEEEDDDGDDEAAVPTVREKIDVADLRYWSGFFPEEFEESESGDQKKRWKRAPHRESTYAFDSENELSAEETAKKGPRKTARKSAPRRRNKEAASDEEDEDENFKFCDNDDKSPAKMKKSARKAGTTGDDGIQERKSSSLRGRREGALREKKRNARIPRKSSSSRDDDESCDDVAAAKKASVRIPRKSRGAPGGDAVSGKKSSTLNNGDDEHSDKHEEISSKKNITRIPRKSSRRRVSSNRQMRDDDDSDVSAEFKRPAVETKLAKISPKKSPSKRSRISSSDNDEGDDDDYFGSDDSDDDDDDDDDDVSFDASDAEKPSPQTKGGIRKPTTVGFGLRKNMIMMSPSKKRVKREKRESVSGDKTPKKAKSWAGITPWTDIRTVERISTTKPHTIVAVYPTKRIAAQQFFGQKEPGGAFCGRLNLGDDFSSHGFFWRYGAGKVGDVVQLNEEQVAADLALKEKRRKKGVEKYCPKTRKLLQKFETASAAYKSLDAKATHNSSYSRYVNSGRLFAHKGFYWRKVNKATPVTDADFDAVDAYVNVMEAKRRPVDRICMETHTILATYRTIREAAVHTDQKYANRWFYERLDTGKIFSNRGYYWRYAEYRQLKEPLADSSDKEDSVGDVFANKKNLKSAVGLKVMIDQSEIEADSNKKGGSLPVEKLCPKTRKLLEVFPTMGAALDSLTGRKSKNNFYSKVRSGALFAHKEFYWRLAGTVSTEADFDELDDAEDLPRKRSFPVDRICTKTHRVLQVYPSIRHALAELMAKKNWTPFYSQLATGKIFSVGGYYWRYSTNDSKEGFAVSIDENEDIIALYVKKKKSSLVEKICMSTRKLLAVYPTALAAAQSYGARAATGWFLKNLREEEIFSHQGYLWRSVPLSGSKSKSSGSVPKVIAEKPHKALVKRPLLGQKKAVEKVCQDTMEVLDTFESISAAAISCGISRNRLAVKLTAAAKELGVTGNELPDDLKEKMMVSIKGYYWRYANKFDALEYYKSRVKLKQSDFFVGTSDNTGYKQVSFDDSRDNSMGARPGDSDDHPGGIGKKPCPTKVEMPDESCAQESKDAIQNDNKNDFDAVMKSISIGGKVLPGVTSSSSESSIKLIDDGKLDSKAESSIGLQIQISAAGDGSCKRKGSEKLGSGALVGGNSLVLRDDISKHQLGSGDVTETMKVDSPHDIDRSSDGGYVDMNGDSYSVDESPKADRRVDDVQPHEPILTESEPASKKERTVSALDPSQTSEHNLFPDLHESWGFGANFEMPPLKRRKLKSLWPRKCETAFSYNHETPFI